MVPGRISQENAIGVGNHSEQVKWADEKQPTYADVFSRSDVLIGHNCGTMATTLAQQKAVAIAPKFTAFASILGSSTAAFLVWKRAPNKTTYHRLVLGMSIVDLIASVAWFFTTWRKYRALLSSSSHITIGLSC